MVLQYVGHSRVASSWVVVVYSIALLLVTFGQFALGKISVIAEDTKEVVFQKDEFYRFSSFKDLEGHLVISNPLDACESVESPPTGVSFGNTKEHRDDKWILLTTWSYTGDSCSLARKAVNAERAGYSALIVERETPGESDKSPKIRDFIGFSWLAAKLYIFVVDKDVGHILRSQYAYPNKYFLTLEGKPDDVLNFIGEVAILFLVSFAVFFVILTKGFYWFYTWTRTQVIRVADMEEVGFNGRQVLSVEQVDRLPLKKWCSLMAHDTCSICLDVYEGEDAIRILPCSHVFHRMCVDRWLTESRRVCPYCTRKVVIPPKGPRTVPTGTIGFLIFVVQNLISSLHLQIVRIANSLVNGVWTGVVLVTVFLFVGVILKVVFIVVVGVLIFVCGILVCVFGGILAILIGIFGLPVGIILSCLWAIGS